MIYTRELFRKFIKDNSDEKYKNFNKKLIRTAYELNGVRIPVLRKHAKFISECENVREFFEWEIENYEQVMLEGLMLSRFIKKKDFFRLLDGYVLKIDDWSLCDSACCVVKRKDEEYFDKCKEYVKSEDVWRARWGIVALMVNFYDKDRDEICGIIKSIKAQGYYLDMALAWFLQAIAAKDSEKAEYIIKHVDLSPEVKKMTLGKIRDSFRIDEQKKLYFKKILCWTN